MRSEYTANQYLQAAPRKAKLLHVKKKDSIFIHPFFVTAVFVAAMVACAYVSNHYFL